MAPGDSNVVTGPYRWIRNIIEQCFVRKNDRSEQQTVHCMVFDAKQLDCLSTTRIQSTKLCRYFLGKN
jgi:hypothetical protein